MLTLLQDDISSFFESHFSSDAVKAFQLQFFNPSQDNLRQVPSDDRGWGEEWEETGYEEDDGLGYYPDGVKRTLTDEEIEIFRHSELHALERQKEKKEDNKQFAAEQALADGVDPGNPEGSAPGPDGGEDGEVQGEEQVQVLSTANNKKRKRKGKNANGNGQPKEQKPDLRKRTWDVVETGLDSLDYD